MTKRPFSAVILLLSLMLLLSVLPEASAKSKKKNGVELSTVDIKEDYEILGLVHYRSNELDPKKINAELTNQAKGMGADYVVGVTYYSNAGYLYGTGTAVRLIEADNPKK